MKRLWKATVKEASDKAVLLTLYSLAFAGMVGLFAAAIVGDAREGLRARKKKDN